MEIMSQKKQIISIGYRIMESPLVGPLLMLSAAFLFTLMSTFIKLMPQGYTVWHFGFIRCFGGLVVLLIFFTKKKNPYKGHNTPLLILRGAMGVMGFFSLVTALRILPISTAIVLFYAYPLFAAFFGIMIYKEKISLYQAGCMAVLVTGVAVLFDFQFTGNAYGQIMAIAGALFFGLTVTLIRSLMGKNGPVIIYLYFCTVGTLLTLPKFLMEPIIPTSAFEWALISGIVVSSVSAQVLMNQGFFFCKGFEGAAYMTSETVFTAVVGILFLNDPVSWRFLVGGILIVGSGLTLNWISRRKTKKFPS